MIVRILDTNKEGTGYELINKYNDVIKLKHHRGNIEFTTKDNTLHSVGILNRILEVLDK